MDIFNQYATDPNKELDGVWTTVGQTKDGKKSEVKVARSGNKRHGKIITALYESNKSTLELKTDAADAKGEEITIEAMAKGILLGWRNLSFKGEVLPNAGSEGDTITPEERLVTAKKLLAVKEFRVQITKLSEDFTKYKIVQDEADAGN
jgi:hypothetical protein